MAAKKKRNAGAYGVNAFMPKGEVECEENAG